MDCTWKKIEGRWVCQAKQCLHWLEGGGCKLGKVSLTCDNNECKWNKETAPGLYTCMTMDIHLDAEGKCLGFSEKENNSEKEI